MYRKILEEIDNVNLEGKSLKDLEPVDESSGEVVIGTLTGNLLRHRILISEYEDRMEEVRLKTIESIEAHQADRGNDELTLREFKLSGKKLTSSLIEIKNEFIEVFGKLNLLQETFEAELQEEFPLSQNFIEIEIREGNQIVGFEYADQEEDNVERLRILNALFRSVLS